MWFPHHPCFVASGLLLLLLVSLLKLLGAVLLLLLLLLLPFTQDTINPRSTS
jgi:hypothetical protein